MYIHSWNQHLAAKRDAKQNHLEAGTAKQSRNNWHHTNVLEPTAPRMPYV